MLDENSSQTESMVLARKLHFLDETSSQELTQTPTWSGLVSLARASDER